MADSENSRTLPAITRRKMLMPPRPNQTTLSVWEVRPTVYPELEGAPSCEATRREFLSGAASIIAGTNAPSAIAGPNSRSEESDPVVALWKDWFMAYRLRGEACRRQQRLETQLLRQFGSVPRARVPIIGHDSFMWAYTTEEIDRLLPDPEQDQARREANAELSARLAEWSAVDEQLGYTKAKQAEDDIAGVEESLAEELWRTPPLSITGVAAKLHAVLETEDPGSGLTESPWQELRIVLADLVRLCEVSRGV